MSRYRIELVGGPLCGTELVRPDLPESMVLPYDWAPGKTDRVTYARMKDGRANPWRYTYGGLA